MSDIPREIIELTTLIAKKPELLKDLHIHQSRLVRLAEHLISNGVTVQKWIPVDPNKHAYTGNRLIALSNGFVTVGYQDGNGVWVYWRNGSIHATSDVTHWMFLPEPPKECE